MILEEYTLEHVEQRTARKVERLTKELENTQHELQDTQHELQDTQHELQEANQAILDKDAEITKLRQLIDEKHNQI